MFFIVLLFSIFCISYVHATNINLDLPGITSENNEETNNVTTNNIDNSSSETNDLTENSNTNSLQNNDINSDENTTYDNILENEPFDFSSETLITSGISSNTETGLGIENIINILLITVGIILILLAIAILIRLRG